MWNWKLFKKNESEDKSGDLEEDKFTKRDFKIMVVIFLVSLLVWNMGEFFVDKAKCAYTGYTYEKPTKRPIFQECLIQMKDGSFVPLERYINRVISFNDLGNEQ